MLSRIVARRVLWMALALCCRASASSEPRFAVGAAPGTVAVADFDGDGKLDLAVANEQGSDVSILLGDGKGGFSPAPGSPFPAGPTPNDIALGDFNRDGRLDLASANHETQHLTVLLGRGRGSFSPAPGSPVAVAVKPHPHGLAAGDFNGDGNLDLATDSWGENRLEILFGDGRGSFRTPGAYVAVGKHPYQRIRSADLNGDGNADIVSPNLEGGDVSILLGDGKGGFRQPAGTPSPCGDAPFNVAIGDVNADGRPDLAIVNSLSSTADRSGRDGLTLLLADGRGGFTRMAGSPFATGRSPNIPAIGDVVVSSPEGDYVTLFTMTRQDSVGTTTRLPVSGHPKGLAVADLNGDRRAEIVVTLNTANQVAVILGR
jgi:VCBS repeat protein